MIREFFHTALLLSMTVLAAPLSGITSSGVAPRFVPNPPGRGTIDILLSCIITQALCVWTAVHPDIVGKKTKGGYLFFKTNMMIAALIMPEVVVMVSFHQWREAKRVHAAWRSLTETEKGSENDIGLGGAFFVVMGGCTVSGISDGFTAIVTPDGFLDLTEIGVLTPHILSRDAVIDKSNADALAKVLLCMQAVWMAVQCAGRVAQGLPVTLLEYHVVIQVGYTVAILFFWWRKPKDVNNPIEVLHRSEIPDDAFATCVRVIPQSKNFIFEEFVAKLFIGHRNAWLGPVLTVPTCLFHLLAWNQHFPSAGEKWIWRVTSIGIWVAPAWIYLHFLMSKHFISYTWGAEVGDSLSRRVYKLMLDKVPVVPGTTRVIYGPREMTAGELVLFVTTTLTVNLFAVCSVLLVAVAFLSLRSVREGSYETVSWGNYWPHL